MCCVPCLLADIAHFFVFLRIGNPNTHGAHPVLRFVRRENKREREQNEQNYRATHLYRIGAGWQFSIVVSLVQKTPLIVHTKWWWASWCVMYKKKIQKYVLSTQNSSTILTTNVMLIGLNAAAPTEQWVRAKWFEPRSMPFDYMIHIRGENGQSLFAYIMVCICLWAYMHQQHHHIGCSREGWITQWPLLLMIRAI